MKQLPNVVILIVIHNHFDFIDQLLESCAAIPGIKKYICDAASSDGSFEKVVEFCSNKNDFNYCHVDKLYGFSKNNNDLIRRYNLQDKNLILLNPDCFFDKFSFYEFLKIVSDDGLVGVAAPKLTNLDGSTQKSWNSFPSAIDFLLNRLGFPLNNKNKKKDEALKGDGKIYSIDWAYGAFLYISKELIVESSVLDERYRLYCEDADVCMMAHSKGMSVVGVDVNGVFHALQNKSASVFSRSNFWNIKSGIKFLLKWNFNYKLRHSMSENE